MRVTRFSVSTVHVSDGVRCHGFQLALGRRRYLHLHWHTRGRGWWRPLRLRSLTIHDYKGTTRCLLPRFLMGVY